MSSERAAVGDGFGDLLRRYRLAAEMSQQELAERSGLSVRAIAYMERGRTTRPYQESVRVLADALALAEPARSQLQRAARLTAKYGVSEPEQPAPGIRVPRQLPAPVLHFVGREADLHTLTSMIDEPELAGGAAVISAIAGPAGVGKTELALHWSHQIADRFPDGQLYANLRGYDPGPPVPPAGALAAFLRALGVPAQDIPPETEERAARYRGLLARRRVLVVLDNAQDTDQVRPLLPGTTACVVVVTSRDSLSGLVARDGARRLELDALPLSDAISLLHALIGQRVAAEPDAAARLANLCCRLPLALRVAAELAAARPALPLTALAEELAGEHRLDRLDAGGDRTTAVRAVLSWSFRHLSADAARTLRLAALHPGMDFDSQVLAAVTGTSHQLARRALAELARAHLVWRPAADRYGMHDLLRDYAAELCAAQDKEVVGGRP